MTISISINEQNQVSVQAPNQVTTIATVVPEQYVSVQGVVGATPLPAFGAEGQALLKASDSSYDVEWDYIEATYLEVQNDDGTSMPAGTLVYAKGVSGNNITVGRADASSSATMPAIGIVTDEIADGASGHIITSGLFNKTISGLSGINVGDTIYVSETAGGVTTTKPTGTALIQNIGIVLKTNTNNIQKMKVSAIDRVNDIPNLAEGYIWIGDADGVPQPTLFTSLDERDNFANANLTVTADRTHNLATNDVNFVQSNGGASVMYLDGNNARVGINTTTPARALHVDGTGPLVRIGDVEIDDEGNFTSKALNSPVVAFKASDDTKITVQEASPGTITFDVLTGETGTYTSTEVVRILGTTTAGQAYVGIGTTTPSSNLHVVGDVRVEGDLTVNGSYTQIDTDVLTTEQWNVTNDGTGPAVTINQKGAQDIMDVQDDGVSVLYIEDGGNVGIGTTSPSKKLHVVGNTTVEGTLFVESANNQVRLVDSDSSGIFSVGVNTHFQIRDVAGNTTPVTIQSGTPDGTLFIKSDGNVGIGTTSPTEKLTVSGNISVSGDVYSDGSIHADEIKSRTYPNYNILNLEDDNVLNSNGVSLLSVSSMVFGLDVNDNSGADQFRWIADGATANTGSVLMALTDEGNLGIGTTSPSARLDCRVPGGSTGSLRLGRTDTASYWDFYHAGNDLRIYNQGGAGNDILLGMNSSGIDQGNKVGIGTASPSAKLDVVGLANINDGSDNVMISSGNTALTTGAENTAVGDNALQSATSASYNSAFGVGALQSNSTGSSNSAFGHGALRDNTAANNTAFGTAALRNKTSGDSNSAFGVNALYTNATGSNNIAVGRSALYNTTGSYNVAIGRDAGYGSGASTFSNAVAVGYQALYRLTTGAQNTAVGHQALQFATTANNNTAIGYEALENSDTSYNTSVGAYSLRDNTVGQRNTAIGWHASSLTTGSYNTSVGMRAGRYGGSSNTSLGYDAGTNTTGNSNVTIGREAGLGVFSTSTFSDTVAVGYQALTALTTGSENTAIGYQAADALTTQGSNTVIGYQALGAATSVENATGVGYKALDASTGNYTAAVGFRSGQNSGFGSVTMGSFSGQYAAGDSNVLIGYAAGQGSSGASTFVDTTAVGHLALQDLTTGAYNTAVGYQAGTNINTGDANTAVGFQAGLNNTEGDDNTFVGAYAGQANTTGDNNAFFGRNAGYTNLSGSVNSFFGVSAGRYNTSGYSNTFLGGLAGNQNTIGFSNSFVGVNAGYSNTSGNNNSFFGRDSGYSNSTGSGNVFIGYQAGYNETGSNKLYIANSNTTTPLIYGEFDNDYVKVNGSIEAGSGTVVSGTDTSTNASIVFPKGTYIKSDDGNYLRNMLGHTSAGVVEVGQYTAFVTGAKINAGVGDFQVYTGNNSERLRIDTSGNVGIGTTSPSYQLDVDAGTENVVASFASADSVAQLRIIDGSSTAFYFGVNGTNAYISPTGATPSDGLAVTSTGNVGIGTASPNALLHVSGSNDGVRIETDISGASKPQLFIEGNKSVGSPSAATIVELKSNIDQRGRGILYTNGGDSTEWYSGVPYQGGGYQIGYDSSGGQAEYKANSSLFINTSGNVGIGTTSPASPLHVYQDDAYTGTQSGITIEQDGVGDAVLQFLLTGARRWVVGADNNDGDRFKIASSSDVGTDDHFEMDGNGVAKFNGDQLQTSSDTEVNYGNITFTQSGTVVNGGFMNPAAEDNMVHLPHVVNDLAGFQKWGTITVSGLYKTRSGSAGSYTYSNPVTAADFDNGASFDGYSSHQGSWYSDNGADGTTVTPGVITLEWTNELRYTAYAGIVFGSTPFTATDVKIEAYRGGAWQELCDITDNSDHVVLRRIENNSGSGASTTKLRFTLGGSVNNSYFRIHTLYAANYQAGNNNLGDYGSTVYTQGVHYLERYKNNNVHGHFNPADDDTYGLGNASQSWEWAYIDDYRVARGGTTYNRLYNDGTRFGIYYDGYTTRSFNILNSNGYVGIGPATTPATQLEVDGDFRASAIQINGRAATAPSNGEYGHGSKLITQFHTSGSVTAGEVYIAGSSAWTQADADARSTSTGLIAVATDAADAAEMLIEGSVKLASNAGFSTASRGDVLYLSLTAGQLTDDISSHTTGDVVRVCGYVINAGTNEVFFSPSKEFTEL